MFKNDAARKHEQKYGIEINNGYIYAIPWISKVTKTI